MQTGVRVHPEEKDKAIMIPDSGKSRVHKLAEKMPHMVLSVDSIFTRSFKALFWVEGITFNVEKKARFVFALCVLELAKHFLATVIGNIANGRNLTTQITDLSIHLIPFIIYINLKLHLKNLNKHFNAFLAEFGPPESSEKRSLVLAIRRFNSLCCLMIIIQAVSLYTIVIGSFERARGWAVKLTFPVDLGLNRTLETVIVLIVCIHNTLISNFIPLTVSLYLSYFKLLTNCKIMILRQMNTRAEITSLNYKLNAVDDLSSTFEKTLSAVPLTWLYYCIGPGLIFMYSLAGFGSKNGARNLGAEAACYLVYQVNNMIITLASLFLISKWREETYESVDLVTRTIKATSHLPAHFGLLIRIQEVMLRPVTVWLICPIDRSLIAAFCGSAITFSTLFIQLQSNP